MKKIIAFFKSLFSDLEYVPTKAFTLKGDIPIDFAVAEIKAAEIKEKKKKSAAKTPVVKKVAKKTANKTIKKKK